MLTLLRLPDRERYPRISFCKQRVMCSAWFDDAGSLSFLRQVKLITYLYLHSGLLHSKDWVGPWVLKQPLQSRKLGQL